jgi:hypothetical protein
MKEFYKLILPETYESIFLLTIAFVLLLLENVKRFWQLLQGETLVNVKETAAVDYTIVDTLRSVIDNINPKLIDFALWALIGCFIFATLSVLIAFFKNINEEADILYYYRNPSSKAHEWHVFVTKYAIKAVGVLGIVLWFFYFLNVLNPKINNLFFTSLASLDTTISIFWITVSVIMLAVCIYVFAILARLIALRPRIFGEQSE